MLLREEMPWWGKVFLLLQNETVSKAILEIKRLKLANEDLSKQVEGLQKNRFNEVEELVYLRWVNACLRYELRHYKAPAGKTTARDLNKDMSPRSQVTAKRLVSEYTGTDVETVSSHPSFPRSYDFDNDSNGSSPSRFSSLSKKTSRTLIRKMKRWWKSNDDFSTVSSPARSIGGSPACRASISSGTSISKGLGAMMMRNTSDGVAITTFGRAEDDSNDSLNRVAASFKLMSKSAEEMLDDRYSAFMDRRKLALERWKLIKKKAYLARTELLSDSSSLNTTSNINSSLVSGAKEEKEQPVILKPKLAQIQEEVVSDSVGSDSVEQPNQNKVDAPIVSETKQNGIEKKASRVPRQPPKPSGGTPNAVTATTNLSSVITTAPSHPPSRPSPAKPPPPPPPGKGISKGPGAANKVHRAPELVEFYHSLMRREAKKDTPSVSSAASNAPEARNNMIEEIENKSSFLMAVKADVENQGDFVRSLANEVRAASFTNIQDVVSFVNWLDEELSFLVDERAVLKHFDWPEAKADTLREASFEYQDIMKLEKHVASFVDDPKLSCDAALKKMYSLLEKIEHSVYAMRRNRDMAISRFKESGIPVDWLQDSGVVGKIKLLSIQLARKYMKRVALELDGLGGPKKEPNKQFLLLQGVRFAFRVHQFAGGFDAESMKAFEELRSRVSPPPNHTNR
ncbi:hypothetical protein AAC387_Pa05g3259 [Persea americana]